MQTQNTLPSVNNLIEELEDEQLASCVGGCHYTNPAGHMLGAGTLGREINGLTNNPSIEWDPNGSARFRSDRALKEAFTEVNAQQVLEKVAALPITTWKYTQEPDSVRHIGPMAQDFAATFGVGDSDRSIHVVDANGVTLAAIQGLYQLLQERDAELDHLKAELGTLKQQIQGAA